MSEQVAVPLEVRLKFGRAAVQLVADDAGVDLLHIKGDAVDPSLRQPRPGTDVDVLVRPRHVRALDRSVRQAGWRLYSSFAYGSPFGHAQTYVHESWGYLDVHRFFPGVRLDADAAFDVLARDGDEIDEVGMSCRVPSVDAQAVLQILNAARTPGRLAGDVDRAWTGATPEERARRAALVEELEAAVAFAAGIGELDRHRGRPDYLLWRAVSRGGSRTAEWWGRIRAARSAREALAIMARAPLVNRERLVHDLGREPTGAELAKAFAGRPVRALAEAWRWSMRRRS